MMMKIRQASGLYMRSQLRQLGSALRLIMTARKKHALACLKTPWHRSLI